MLKGHIPFFVAYHLNGYKLIILVVQAFQDLPKGPFPNHFKHFKPVGNVVMQHLKKQRKDCIMSHYTVLYLFFLAT